MAYGIGSAGSTPATITGNSIRETTALEQHLNALGALYEDLSKAMTRALHIADRVIGQEPPSITKNDTSPKDGAEPPLLRRLELAVVQANEMTTAIHYHLNRLERL